MNPVTGEKAIEINGQRYVMKYTWRALSEIEYKHGDNPNLFDPDVLAEVAEIGMRERHPEMTAEAIMKLSPPLMPFAKDVQTAIHWAYFGNDAILSEGGASVKKNPKAGGYWRRIAALFRRGYTRLIFGA